MEMKSKALQFLTKHTSRNWSKECILSASLSFFNDIGTYRGNNDSDRLIDMLMFDFDTEHSQVEALKKRLKDAYNIKNMKAQKREVARVQDDFQKLLFSSDLLKQPFMDAMRLAEYFKRLGIRTYTVFSGSKGLHLYVFLPKLYLSNISQVTLKLATKFKDKLDLRSLDVSVSKDSLKRMDRVPYSRHEKTRLFATPCCFDDDIIDVLKDSRKQKVREFNFTDYMLSKDNTLVKTLVKMDNNYHKISNAKVNQSNFYKLRRTVAGGYTGSADDLFKDMRNLARLVLGEPVKEYNAYNVYLCPFHDDHHPSARVYRENFHCEACGVHYRYFDFIKNYFGLKSDKETKAKMKKLRKKKFP